LKILFINGKYLSQTITGVQRYAAEIVRAWDKGLQEGWINRDQYSIQVIAPKNASQSPDYRHIEIVYSSTSGRVWEQIELPWRTRGHLLFSPYAAAPLVKKRHAVTIHDAGAAATPQQYSLGFRVYYSLVYRILGKTCKPVFTVSEFSRRELEHFFSIPAEKIRVIPPGCDHILNVPADPCILERSGLKKGQYILGVSSLSIIKNFESLSKAWTLLGRSDIKLAIAGRVNNRLFGSGSSTINDNTVRLGYVSDSELRSLYENAALFAYPSFYEGFGLPPVEAMACGCPVLVARSSALPETCGDAAVYCNPTDIADIAEKISLVLDNPAMADALKRKGKCRLGRFTVRSAASHLWAEISPYL
jgi:glycosyltransferase involved in cell wall biosynthesis